MEDDNLDSLILPALTIQEVPVKSKRVTEETKAKVKDLIASGKSVREVGALLNISKSTVSTISKKGSGAPAAEKIPTNTIEHMDDSAFAKVIQGVTETAPVAKDVRDKGNFLNKFMREMDETSGPNEPKKGRKKAVKELLDFAPMGPMVPVVQDEDKSIYITKIQMNIDNFADVLRDHIKPDRDSFMSRVCKMSTADLKQTLSLLETVRSSNNLANQLKYLLFGATGLIEAGTQRFLGMKTRGYADMVRQQDAEIQSCLREIAINNVESYKKVERPEMRLATVLITTLLATDSRNRMEDIKTHFETKQVSPETAEKFQGL
jgi:predicted transcriptional regulator